jgi:hypothetical protein
MSNDISALRAHLFNQLKALRETSAETNHETLKAELAKAAGVAELAKAITDTARLEVDYLRASGGGESSFIDTAVGANALPPGITGITRHRLKG